MKKRLVIFCSGWMIGPEVRNLKDWRVYVNPGEPDPEESSPAHKFGPTYVGAIRNIKPDVVLSVNIGCTEPDFDRMEKPTGPTYVTWSTDSYRHTRRAETSDLHLSAIPDSSFDDNRDIYLPLWFDRPEGMDPIPLEDRTIPIGIIFRPYGIAGRWRERHVEYIARVVPGLRAMTNVPRAQYLDEIRRFRLGLNVPVYSDALPNFRSYELAAFGVKAVSPGVDDNVFQSGYSVENPIEVQEFIGTEYDWEAIVSEADKHHRFINRLRAIFDILGETL